MNFSSIGDLSGAFVLRRSNIRLRNDIRELSQELATGIKFDIPKHLRGDLSMISKIEQRLVQVSVFKKTATEVANLAATMQSVLATVQGAAEASSRNMLSIASPLAESSLRVIADESFSQLSVAIGALNTSVSARYILSGNKVSTPALISAKSLLDIAKTVTSGANTAEEAMQRLNAWFEAAPGAGGFSDVAYQGDGEANRGFMVDSSGPISLPQSANNPGIRKILLGLVAGALGGQGLFGADSAERVSMMKKGGVAMMEGGEVLSFLRADIGFSEQRIELTSARLEKERLDLQVERADLVQSDSYEAGSQLLQAQTQIESLFAMTSRLSSLSLARYL